MFLKTLIACRKLIVASLALSLFGCIVPPEIEEARVLSPDELRLISTVQEGKQFSRSGRMDLAEERFRLAIEQKPGLDNVYNDLAYSLQSQARLDEAILWYRDALKIAPDNVIARENLVRVLYQTGEYRSALIENLRLMDTMLRLEPEELSKIVGQPWGPKEIVPVFRTMANIYYTVGVYDDAACYSWLAFAIGANMYEAGQHSRLLLSLDRTDQALATLRQVVIANSGEVPPKVMVDYGMTLYLHGQKGIAETAVEKVLTQTAADRVDRRTARLIRLLIANGSGNKAEAELIIESILEDDTEFCEREELDEEGYWPLAFLESVEAAVKDVCTNENESLA